MSRFLRYSRVMFDMNVLTSEQESDYHTRFRNIEGLYGTGSLQRLKASHVCVIGLGGVGSWAVEALARSGIGKLTLIDMDDICLSNVNRQIQALTSNVGKFKADSLKVRVHDVNPYAIVETVYEFIRKENVDMFINSTSNFQVVLDAADSVSDKSAIIDACRRYNIPIVTTGGVGGLVDPTLLRVSDLSSTNGDNLLKQVRKKLRQKYGYPSIDEADKKLKPEHKVKRRPWGIPAIHTLPTGTARGLPIVCDAVDPEVKDKESTPKKRVGDGGFRKCDTNFGNACFTTGTAGFIMASIATKQIATGSYLIPDVFVTATAESIAYREEFEAGMSDAYKEMVIIQRTIDVTAPQ